MADPTTPKAAAPAGFVADDQTGAGIQPLGQSGWLTVSIDGTAYRLRNPLFGELKKLRLALAAVTDEIEAANQVAVKLAGDIGAHATALGGKAEDEQSTAERRKTAKLVDDARKAGRDLVDTADDRRMGWWTLVFDTLSVDGTPPDWPAWLVDINLPGRVMEHWRTVPLAPGR